MVELCEYGMEHKFELTNAKITVLYYSSSSLFFELCDVDIGRVCHV